MRWIVTRTAASHAFNAIPPWSQGVQRLTAASRWQACQPYSNARALQEGAPSILSSSASLAPQRSGLRIDDSQNSAPRDRTFTEVTPAPLESTPWRNRLRTHDHYQYETNFDIGVEKRVYLVDEYPNDWQLWYELLEYRERHSGFPGVRSIWAEILKRQLDLPTDGAIADRLWNKFVVSGLQDEAFMEDILDYAQDLRRRTDEYWANFYIRVIQHHLRFEPQTTLSWHRRLKKVLPPRLSDYEKLFQQALNEDTLNIFKILYLDRPIPHIYPFIVPTLCRRDMFRDALKWHFLLTRTNDYPTKIEDVTALFEYYKKMKEKTSFRRLLASVRGKIDQLPDLEESKSEQPPMNPPALSDNLCARLFATKLLPVEGILNGLELFGVSIIGAAALREIAFRSNFDCFTMREYLKHMEVNGIRPESSKYGDMLCSAAQNDQTWLLRSIVESDAHPDTFNNFRVQEELLTMYWSQRDMEAVERTISVLTWGAPDVSATRQRQNLMLRVHLRLNQDVEVRRMIEDMKACGSDVTPSSIKLLRSKYLKPRHPGEKMARQDMLYQLTNVIDAMKLSLDTGGNIPIESWKEILRRLGMNGSLSTFRYLALWLAKKYATVPTKEHASVGLRHDPNALDQSTSSRPVQVLNISTLCTKGQPLMSTTNVPEDEVRDLAMQSLRGADPPRQSPSANADLGHCNARHRRDDTGLASSPLLELFTPISQRAIIAWGFHQDLKQPPKETSISELQFQQTEWSWGIQLLRDLKDLGVPVSDSLVRKQCQRRLAILFGRRQEWTEINRKLRDQNSDIFEGYWKMDEREEAYQAYLQRMEEIWGKPIARLDPRRKPWTVYSVD